MKKVFLIALALCASVSVVAQNDGVTSLLTAIYQGDVQTVDRLIAAGANVRAANREGVTPLAMACLDGDLAIIDRLLKAGADPKERGPNGETMLMFAARNGRVDVLKRLLACLLYTSDAADE